MLIVFLKNNKQSLLVFFFILVIYLINLPFDYSRDHANDRFRRLLTSLDNVPNTFLPHLILEEKTLFFDSIYQVTQRLDSTDTNPYFLIPVERGVISVYPLITPLFTLPFYAPVSLLFNPDLTQFENILNVMVVSRLSAAFYTSLSILFLFQILKKNKGNHLYLFTAYIAFGTLFYSILSRGMWMHTISVFLICYILYLLFTKNPKPFLIGLLFGILVLIRITNLTFVVPIALYYLFNKRKQLMKLVLGGIPSVVLLLFNNYYFFGNIFSEGYSARSDISWSTSLTESIPGFLISPARGLLFISPLLIVSVITIYKVFKDSTYLVNKNTLFRYLVLFIVFQILLFGKWWAWAGANAFGHRMLSEIIPVLALFSYEVIQKVKGRALLLLYFLVIYSFYIHTNAVIFRKSRCSFEHTWDFECILPPKRLPKY